MLPILFTAAGIVVAVLVVAAFKRVSKKREQQLRDDLADSDERLATIINSQGRRS
jgi:biopolymer transport protein ExbB/TolQ